MLRGVCPKADIVREVACIYFYRSGQNADKGGRGSKNPKILRTSFMYGPKGWGKILVYRFGEFFSCCCLKLLPQLACSTLASRNQGMVIQPTSVFPRLFQNWVANAVRVYSKDIDKSRCTRFGEFYYCSSLSLLPSAFTQPGSLTLANPCTRLG